VKCAGAAKMAGGNCRQPEGAWVWRVKEL
jgi:hypothetical protein